MILGFDVLSIIIVAIVVALADLTATALYIWWKGRNRK